MALTLFVNTYLVDASPYLSGDPTWEAASTQEKEQSLVNATTMLDNSVWAGVAKTPTQPLAWPRKSFRFFDPVLGLSVPVEEDSIPVRLEKAVAQQAIHLLRYPEVIEGYSQSYDSISVGPISLTNTNGQKGAVTVPRLPTFVNALLKPLLVETGSATSWWRAN